MPAERSGRRALPWARRSALSLPLLWLAQATMPDLPWRDGVMPLELDALDAGPRQTLTTHTHWTSGPQQFEGTALRDAALMPVRDRGPFWLVYPWADHPTLDQPEFHRRSMWQVRAIQFG